MITVQLLKGEKDAAMFSLSLLEETPRPEDASFIKLAHTIGQNNPLEDTFEPTNMLEAKLWLRQHKNLPALPPHFLPLAISDKTYQNLSPKEKILMAERAFKEGVANKESLKEVLQKLYQHHGTKESSKTETPKSTQEDTDQSIKIPPVPLDWEKNDPLTRAELYVKLKTTHDMERHGYTTNTAQHLIKHHLYDLAPLFMEDLKALPLEDTFKDHAPVLVELFCIMGK